MHAVRSTARQCHVAHIDASVERNNGRLLPYQPSVVGCVVQRRVGRRGKGSGGEEAAMRLGTKQTNRLWAGWSSISCNRLLDPVDGVHTTQHAVHSK